MAKASDTGRQNYIKNYLTKDKINEKNQWSGSSFGVKDELTAAKKLHRELQGVITVAGEMYFSCKKIMRINTKSLILGAVE